MAPLTTERVTLTGRFVELRPLVLDDTDALAAVGLDPDLWRHTVNQVTSHADMKRYIESALEEQTAGRSLPFVIVSRSDRRVVGCTRYGNIDRHHRRVEIGWTWVAPPWQRTPINTEAKPGGWLADPLSLSPCNRRPKGVVRTKM